MTKSTETVSLRLNKDLRQELLAAAEDEIRNPAQMMNLLLRWALQQKRLLNFDTSMLLKVNLSLSELDAEAEPWNRVVSGELIEGPNGTFQKLVVR